jgi:biotin-[acetyl-CoA-carboxylase] ligase BirA-like protein
MNFLHNAFDCCAYDYARVTSTQDIAHDLLLGSIGCSWIWVRSDQQSKGKGRVNKTWQSPLGGFYGTLLCSWPYDHQSLLSLACALSVMDVLQDLGIICHLKWINDIMVNQSKIAGILVEIALKKNAKWCLAGIGINVNTLPQINEQPITCIKDCIGHSLDINAIWNELNAKLRCRLDQLASGLEQKLIQDIENKLLYKNQYVYIRTSKGYFSGIFQKILPSGEIMLGESIYYAQSMAKELKDLP